MRDWTSSAPAAQTRSLSRRCRVPRESDDSKIAAQRFLCEPGMPSGLDREFAQNDNYARHRPIRSRALRSDSRNPECSSPTDAGGEICNLQSCGSANDAKECAPDRLLSFATNERDSRRIILLTSAVFERQSPLTFHLRRRLRRDKQSSPRKRSEARYCMQCCVFSCWSETRWPARSVRLRENKCDTARHPASRASNPSTPRAHQ